MATRVLQLGRGGASVGAAHGKAAPMEPAAPASKTEPGEARNGEGVAIDRSVFRPLRRKGNSGLGEAPGPLPPGAGYEGTEPLAFEAQSKPSAWVDDLRQSAEGFGEDLGPFGGYPYHLDRQAEGLSFAAQDLGVARRASSLPASRGGEPQPFVYWSSVPHETSRCATPKMRRSARGQRKSDPVSRGAQLRALWSRDRFLRSTGTRKFDLRGCGTPLSPVQLWTTMQPFIPSYVPPHEKRRDQLRLEVRELMRPLDTF